MNLYTLTYFATLHQFAGKEEWNVLCDTLASRLLSAGDMLAATLCYICAGNIDKAVEIWSRSLRSEDGGKTYVDLLQVQMDNKTPLFYAMPQPVLIDCFVSAGFDGEDHYPRPCHGP